MTLRTIMSIGLALLAAGAAQAETRLYSLDSRNAEEITEALDDVVRAQCPPQVIEGANPATYATCHVELLPTGQIIVEAPAEIHGQIAEVLKAIAVRDAEPTPRITLQYWVVSGSADGAERAEPPNGLAPVFAQLRRLHGDLAFAVQESASLTTESGTKATSAAGTLRVENTVRANGNNLRAEIDLEYTMRPGRACAQAGCQPFQQMLGLTTSIKRGEYLVLGERAFNTPDGRGTMFYVVHWPDAN
jgi:hypothetical protein